LFSGELPILEHMAKVKQNGENQSKNGDETVRNNEEEKKNQVRNNLLFAISINHNAVQHWCECFTDCKNYSFELCLLAESITLRQSLYVSSFISGENIYFLISSYFRSQY
jgi:hypothetical protein